MLILDNGAVRNLRCSFHPYPSGEPNCYRPVASVFLFLLPTKSLCHNDVTDVSPFSEHCIYRAG